MKGDSLKMPVYVALAARQYKEALIKWYEEARSDEEALDEVFAYLTEGLGEIESEVLGENF